MTGTNSTSASVNDLYVMGVEFDASSRDPRLTATANIVHNDPTGINILSKSNDLLIENCKVENYYVDINFQDFRGGITNVAVRRNVILNSWSSDAPPGNLRHGRQRPSNRGQFPGSQRMEFASSGGHRNLVRPRLLHLRP